MTWWRWCLSVYSYIKPQLQHQRREVHRGVYLSIPTSNHNSHTNNSNLVTGVYLSIPTSNHN